MTTELPRPKEGDIRIKGSIVEWAAAMRADYAWGLAKKFSESEAIKIAGLEMIRKLGLPHLEGIPLPLPEFLTSPEVAFEQLGEGKYHVSLFSDKWEARKPGLNLDRSGTINYIEETVPPEKRADFKVILKRFYENKYGMNILIGKDGSVFVELTPGLHLYLARGVRTPTIIARSDQFTGRMQYFKVLEDKTRKLKSLKMRKTIWKTLEHIPKDTENTNGKLGYHQGYYEGILYEEDGELLPLYNDYRDSDIYQLDNSPTQSDINLGQKEKTTYSNKNSRGKEMKEIDMLLAKFVILAKKGTDSTQDDLI